VDLLKLFQDSYVFYVGRVYYNLRASYNIIGKVALKRITIDDKEKRRQEVIWKVNKLTP